MADDIYDDLFAVEALAACTHEQQVKWALLILADTDFYLSSKQIFWNAGALLFRSEDSDIGALSNVARWTM